MQIIATTTKTYSLDIFEKVYLKNKCQMPPDDTVKQILRDQRTKNNPLDSDDIINNYVYKILTKI